MKKISLFVLLFLISGFAISQEIQKVAKAKEAVSSVVIPDSLKTWYFGGIGSLSFNQAAFSNWAAGGQNSIGLDAFLDLTANYHKGRHIWGNTLNLGYGFSYLGKGSNAKFTKTNDKIEYTSAYGYNFSKNKKWLLTVLLNFRTQFSAGYNYPDDSTMISNFMSPGYLVAGIGFTYAPANWFYVYMSPASGRFTFVLDQKLSDAGSFGVDKGKKLRSEFGPYVRANLNKDLSKTINLTTTLALFTNYMKNFGNIDVNWDLLLTMKVNKWLAASITTQLIYDDDIIIQPDPTEAGGPRTQFKELLGIGVTYKIH
jgi:hypothetical protein